METKVYMKIKGHVFECLPSQTEVSMDRDIQYASLNQRCPGPTTYAFTAAITTPQPWSCEVQKMWRKLAKKRRTVHLAMVLEDSATELVYRDVDITFLSQIEGSMFTEEITARPFIPSIKGETMSPVETINHERSWWEL
jgi:hypothetical protein